MSGPLRLLPDDPSDGDYTLVGWRLGRRHTVSCSSREHALALACEAARYEDWAPTHLLDAAGHIIVDETSLRATVAAALRLHPGVAPP